MYRYFLKVILGALFTELLLFLLLDANIAYWSTVHVGFDQNVKDLIEKNGYPFENHTVVTTDGYILELHRIPYGRNNKQNKRSPVLAVHGLLAGPADFVNNGPEKSLGFILADNGYDVWLGNCRGSTWSRKHIQLNPDVDKKAFWNFSFQEIGLYDLPAFIDHVLNTTKQERLLYIGHSQGSTSLLALISDRPEYNEKLLLVVAFAPVVYVKHTTSLILRFLRTWKYPIEVIIDNFQNYEFLRNHAPAARLGQRFCGDGSPFQSLCAAMFFLASGYSNQFNKTLIPVIAANAPAGSSMKQLLHFAQVSISDVFEHYDKGEDENLVKYGQSKPPPYNLSRVTSPVVIYYGSEDVYLQKQDAIKTIAELPNVIEVTFLEGFNHIDYIWGKDVENLVYVHLLDILNKYR